jgi:hypothetical protein
MAPLRIASGESRDAVWMASMPFEAIAYGMARMRGKGWNILILLIVILAALLPIFLKASRGIDLSMAQALGIGAVVVGLLLVAKTRVGSFELGSAEVELGWKVILFIPGALILWIGTPLMLSAPFDRADTMIRVRNIADWALLVLFGGSLAASLLRWWRARG